MSSFHSSRMSNVSSLDILLDELLNDVKRADSGVTDENNDGEFIRSRPYSWATLSSRRRRTSSRTRLDGAISRDFGPIFRVATRSLWSLPQTRRSERPCNSEHVSSDRLHLNGRFFSGFSIFRFSDIGVPSPTVQVRSLEPRSSYPQSPTFPKVKEH